MIRGRGVAGEYVTRDGASVNGSRDPSSSRSTAQAAILGTARGGTFLAGGQFFEFGARFFIAFLIIRL